METEITNSAAKAHGLDGSWVEPDWPPLTLAEVRALLRQFPQCGEARAILTVSPRPFSAASVVATGTGRVFVKRHHRAVRDREGLHEEHRFMAHLRARGAAVPRVLVTASDETAVEDGVWTYEVHEVPEGVDIYSDALSWTPFLSCDHARHAGEALALLHCAARGFNAPPRAVRPLVASFSIFAGGDPAAQMERYRAARPALANDADAMQGCQQALGSLAPFHAELLPLLPALSPLWTHNDLHGSNLLWSDASENAQAACIIDFGLADRTTAMHDLAHAIERNIIEWLDLLPGPTSNEVRTHLDHLTALLDGYDAVRPLSREEAAALAPMVALCHAEFALTEADYFLGVLHSPEKARLASLDYLVGHARWFHTEGGTKLLNAIRQWAQRRNSGAKEAAE